MFFSLLSPSCSSYIVTCFSIIGPTSITMLTFLHSKEEVAMFDVAGMRNSMLIL